MLDLQFSSALDLLRQLLGDGDVRSALAYLNQRTPHRFTALYLFDHEGHDGHFFYDAQDPTVERAADVPVMATYCVFVRESKATFHLTEESRPSDEAEETKIQAFTGVPLLDASGEIFGTVCHFDFEPVTIADEHVALLEAAAPLFKKGLIALT